MSHDVVILKARLRLLESDNLLLKQKIREKNNEIKILKTKNRKLELKIPHKIQEVQLSLDEFV